ncbi:FAD/NAD(P)-binding domain-containing protein [Gymnopus androsaceus JB14]|uniref:FAD/NAD(P)-binding domain-containing protein n=1 Tax=Gymnopus androsaceus JB14 TaxID=1447944 RepID=A0A6A4HP44_9AGAR|nr:FAD/NAD(P)-binding domain-containing protein [Gymnopus androsaceus JB14]
MDTLAHPKRILIIGAGPSGIVTLRNLIKLGSFDRVEIVERRDDVGGVWYFDEDDENNASDTPRWPSPAYPGLIGNVLPEFLSFSGSPFPEPPTTPHQPFPTLRETYDYLRGFAEVYLERGNIRLNTEVVRVEELEDGKGWNVTTRDWRSPDRGEIRSEVWDAVVVCTGWYDDPLWPGTPGMEDLKKKGLAVHAKWYRGPQKYTGKTAQRALIIGNGNSANDIAAHLVPLAKNPVYRSIRRPAFKHFVSLPDVRIKDVSPVKRFILQDNDKVTAELLDETIIEI